MKGFAIVGLGAIASLHAKALEEARGCRLVGAYSPIAPQVASFSSTWGCRGYGSLSDLLADRDVECVSVCAPSGSHLETIVAAAEAGKQVISEKPLEINEERCAAAVRAAERAGVVLAGIFQSRFYAAARLIKAALREGRFGRVSRVGAYVPWFRTQEYYDASGWRGTWALDGGGAYMNQAIHMADLLRWLFGNPASVVCRAAALGHDRIEVEDTAAAILVWNGGPIGVLESTTAAYPGYLKRLELSGTGGTAIMEEDRLVEWRFADERAEDQEVRARYGVGILPRSGVTRFEEEHVPHRRVYENFAAALDGKESLEVDGPEAGRTVALVRDLYRSAGLIV